MTDPIADILALFAVPRPQPTTWVAATEVALRRTGFMLYLARNLTRAAYKLCRAGHPFVVEIADDLTITITLRTLSATVSVVEHGLVAVTRYKGFPSVVVPDARVASQEPIGFEDDAFRFGADRVTMEVMRQFHAAMG